MSHSRPLAHGCTRRRHTPILRRLLLFSLFAALLIGAAYFALQSVITATQKKLYPLKYEDLIAEASAEFDVPQVLICAVIRTESRFDPDAVSAAGARGLMQLMPKTYEWLMTKLGEEPSEELALDPRTNIRCGTYQLSRLYARFGDWTAALAAYNAGEGIVSQWLKDPAYAPEGALTSIPYKETRNYVKKVNDAIDVYVRLYDLAPMKDASVTEESVTASSTAS